MYSTLAPNQIPRLSWQGPFHDADPSSLSDRAARERPYKCQYPGCTSAYSKSRNLRAHESQKHGRKKKFSRAPVPFNLREDCVLPGDNEPEGDSQQLHDVQVSSESSGSQQFFSPFESTPASVNVPGNMSVVPNTSSTHVPLELGTNVDNKWQETTEPQTHGNTI